MENLLSRHLSAPAFCCTEMQVSCRISDTPHYKLPHSEVFCSKGIAILCKGNIVSRDKELDNVPVTSIIELEKPVFYFLSETKCSLRNSEHQVTRPTTTACFRGPFKRACFCYVRLCCTKLFCFCFVLRDVGFS